jgi:stress response protein SCP2
MEVLIPFYFKRRYLLLNEPEESNAKTKLDAYRMALRFDGLKPLTLAKFPKLIALLEDAYSGLPEAIVIQETLLTKAAHIWMTPESSIEDYMTKLTKGGAAELKLLNRLKDIIDVKEACSICFEDDCDTYLNCGHRFCSSCATKLSTCPFCRSNIEERMKSLSVKKQEEHASSTPKYTMVEDIQNFLDSRANSLLKNSSTLDKKSAEELRILIVYRPSIVADLLLKTKTSQEVLAFCCASLYSRGYSENIPKSLRTPDMVIRFLNVLAGGDPVQNQRLNLKIDRKLRKCLMIVIDAFQNVEHQMIKRRWFWVWLFRKMHVSSYPKYAVANSLADLVRGKRKVSEFSVLGRMNTYYMNKDPMILEIFKSYPGLALRNILSVIKRFGDALPWDQLEIICAKLTVPQLIDLDSLLERLLITEEEPVYRTRNGTIYWKEKVQVKSINPQSIKRLRRILGSALCTRKIDQALYVEKQKWDYVKINKGRPTVVPEWVQRNCSAGDRLEVPRNADVIFFLHWMCRSQVDLDLSVLLYNDQEAVVGHVDFTRLVQYGIKHSGDFVFAYPPNGSSEYICFKPSALPSDVHKIVLCCVSFSGTPFESLDRALVGIGVRDKSGKGQGPEGSEVLAASQLVGKARLMIAGIYDVKTSVYTFSNLNVPKRSGSFSVRSRSRDISRIVDWFRKWTISKSPASFGQIINTYMKLASKVKIYYTDEQTNAVRSAYFQRRNEESSEMFSLRVAEGKDEDKEGLDTKIIYFGTRVHNDLEGKDVTLISKSDPIDPRVKWVNDPYYLVKT